MNNNNRNENRYVFPSSNKNRGLKSNNSLIGAQSFNFSSRDSSTGSATNIQRNRNQMRAGYDS